MSDDPWADWEASITDDLIADRDLLRLKLRVAANGWRAADQDAIAAVARAKRAEARANRAEAKLAEWERIGLLHRAGNAAAMRLQTAEADQ